MQEDFHYYSTYCAAFLSGFSHEECLDICYSAQLVDLCSKTFLSRIKGPQNAATTMLSMEMLDSKTDILSLQEITRIWSSFHFLPYDLYAKKKWRTRRYMNKYSLICGPDSPLAEQTVRLAKNSSIQHIGIVMHVLADTWAHAYFAGTPSLVINNTDSEFYEVFSPGIPDKKIRFIHKPSALDDPDKSVYVSSVFQSNENSVMNLGHGRAGHLPDYSFIRYRYIPAWGGYREIVKDNPAQFRKAFAQMVQALRFLRGDIPEFEKGVYDTEVTAPYTERIGEIIDKRQLIASDDWRSFGEELSGKTIPGFDLSRYQQEYIESKDKSDTFLGKFIGGALMHKGMVTDAIFSSGNILAGLPKFSHKKEASP